MKRPSSQTYGLGEITTLDANGTRGRKQTNMKRDERESEGRENREIRAGKKS